MPETLNKLPGDSSKEEVYSNLLPQIKSLVEHEPNLIANLANISAALRQTFNFFWVGFYMVEQSSGELVLGPFQVAYSVKFSCNFIHFFKHKGPIACTRIKKGRGVCGTSYERKESVIVPDVDKFPGHIGF